MAVLLCVWNGSETLREDDAGIISITRQLRVETEAGDSSVVVYSGLKYPVSGVPLGSVFIQKFDRHPDAGRLLLRGVDIDRTNSPTVWTVTLSWSNAPFPALQQGTGGTALPVASSGSAITPSNDPSTGNNYSVPAPDRIPTWSYKSKTVTEPGEMYKDWVSDTTKAYVNPNGDKIEGLEVERYNLLMSVTYYSSEMTDAAIAERIGAVNLDVYRGFAAGGVIVRDVQREDVYDFLGYDGSDEVFGLIWKVTIELEAVNVYGFWNTRLLNVGRRGRLSTGGPILTLVDRLGERISDPVPLDADGVVLRDPALATPTPITPAEFTYTTYYDRPRFDFDDLLI